MKILHYSLGFPPFRTGGLTTYSFDLMKEQARQGKDVSLLWPGKISVINNNVTIKRKNNEYGIKSFELINPLPVGLDEGIDNIELYTKSTNINIFLKFLSEEKPSAIHIHTLMGLYKEFIEAANILNIKLVYTSHDKFGICPKVTMFRDGDICNKYKDCSGCKECNNTALPMRKIILMQSPVYRKYKDSKLIRYLRKIHRRKFYNNDINKNNTKAIKESIKADKNYIFLRDYYLDILKKIDTIHFNSKLTYEIFSEFFEPKNYIIKNISHMNIKNHKKIKKFDGTLKITFLSQCNEGKGFNVLKKALDMLYNSNKNFVLNVYDDIQSPTEYMNVKGKYKYEDLKDIFEETDVLVAPSVWKETFGFTVLEALSYGVPVLISDRVGAKDIVLDKYGWIYKGKSYMEMYKILLNVSTEELEKKNLSIYNDFIIESFQDYVKNNNLIYMS